MRISICHILETQISYFRNKLEKLAMFSLHNEKFAKLSKHTRSRIMCMQIAKWPLIVALLHIVCVCNVHISTCPIHPNKPLSLLFTSHCLPLHTACACGTFGQSHRVDPGREKRPQKKEDKASCTFSPAVHRNQSRASLGAAFDCIPLGL